MPNQHTGTPVAIRHREQILSQVSEGVHLQSIADAIGTTPAAISQQLSKDPEYKKARESGAEVRLERQYQRIEEADDALNLARAREGFRAAGWFAEREFPHRWGQKQQIDHHITLDLGAKLRQAELAIDGQCTIDAIPSDYVKLEDK